MGKRNYLFESDFWWFSQQKCLIISGQYLEKFCHSVYTGKRLSSQQDSDAFKMKAPSTYVHTTHIAGTSGPGGRGDPSPPRILADKSYINGGSLCLAHYYYTQSPIIKNSPIRNDAEILGKFKERTLSRSKLRNA